MSYQDVVSKIIFSSFLSKKNRKLLKEKALNEFYGKFIIPPGKINLEEKRVPGGGLL
jgi:hypothetical protein